MSGNFIRAGGFLAAALFALAAFDGVAEHIAPGASAGEYQDRGGRSRTLRRKARPETSTPEEIAKYFQLYGGFIDPYINRQTPAGPFDSGFFFDSGRGPNGGQSPYMN